MNGDEIPGFPTAHLDRCGLAPPGHLGVATTRATLVTKTVTVKTHVWPCILLQSPQGFEKPSLFHPTCCLVQLSVSLVSTQEHEYEQLVFFLWEARNVELWKKFPSTSCVCVCYPVFQLARTDLARNFSRQAQCRLTVASANVVTDRCTRREACIPSSCFAWVVLRPFTACFQKPTSAAESCRSNKSGCK